MFVGIGPAPELPGDTRTWRVWLDCNQYQSDMEKVAEGGEVLSYHHILT